MDPSPQEFDRPKPPDDLVQACATGEGVAYIGAGLSAGVGFPTWQIFVHGLLAWAVEASLVAPDLAESLRVAVDTGDVDPVADEVVSAAMERNRPALYEYLQRVFLRPMDWARFPASRVHSVLADIPFSAVLTTNFDNLLEATYTGRRAPVFTPNRPEPLLDSISKREFFILKLYGTLDQPESVLVAPAQYKEVVTGNLPFSQCMETLFFSRTLLFIGASLEGIEAYLDGISLPTSVKRRHYALVAVNGRGWEAKARVHERRYGIRVIPYTPTEGYLQVLDFLSQLRDRVDVFQGRILAADFSDPGSVTQAAPLKRILLENIGPFEFLDLDLQPRWNILLGDNGTGKSTILRAIAMAIVGKDAQAFASRVIRSAQTTACITLETERNTYRALVRSRTSGEDADFQCIPGRPLEAEGWLALGFPPLRTVSWDRPKAPESEVHGRPTPGDLLPLVTGAPDPRLDKLKQWIVNLDYWIKDERSRTGSGGRYERLLHTFFRVVGELTEGLQIEFKEVKPQTNEVTILTADGELPLEAVSQGTASLMGWVGILLQRLYEVFGDDEDPTQRSALVLIDEIDAHLHPGWQRTLVQKLSTLFPNVQFIATTHSPLIVAGMPPEQIFCFIREEEGRVVRMPVDAEMSLGRADQILTSDLFGLHTTVDPVTEGAMDRYRELLGKRERTPEEEEEFWPLHRVLQARIPVSRETPVERQAQELLQALLQEQVGDLFPEAQGDVLDRAEKLLMELQKQSGRAS
ncbi:MAG TPA: AAA family ATPase [Thermoanaerobaculia bacterium]|nr:AAA family ATPase [Thermoanaerobaculia bacterium]